MAQGIATFPGITQILGATFTLSRGISPSVATIRCVPQAGFLAEVGTLRFDFGSVHLEFKDCALDLASLKKDKGGLIWTIRILDRRWKWKNEGGGHWISGHYNQRKKDGELNKDTEKKPQELAKLLLEAMGETGFDLSELPNDPRPEVRWDYANPAQQLAELCDLLACHVVLQLNNKVKLCRNRKGKKLPADGTVVTGGYGFDVQAKPDKLLIVGDVLKFESKFLLEPVGLDTDGSIKHIDDLSYKPDDGWAHAWPGQYFDGLVSGTYKKDGKELYAYELANKTVWRWFRVKEQATGGLKPPSGLDDKIKVEKLEQILPLGDGLLETVLDDAGRKVPKEYEITGNWCQLNDTMENTGAGTLYAGQFDVDRERGIVKFSDPLVFYDDSAGDEFGVWFDPELYLRTTYGVKDEKQLPIRYTRERKVPGGNRNTGHCVLKHPQIERTIRSEYFLELEGEPVKVKKTHDNLKFVDKEADTLLDVAIKNYETDPSEEFEYAGLRKIELDGAIAQVTWKVGDKAAATTRASRNLEGDIYSKPYDRRRAEEKARDKDEKAQFTDVDVRRVAAFGAIA